MNAAKQIWIFIIHLCAVLDLTSQTMPPGYCRSNPFDQLSQNIEQPVAIVPRNGSSIPVVVHVLYKDESENISDEQIRSQMDVLNEDFNGANPDLLKVPDLFKSQIGSPGFNFCLAARDPDGNPTSGILRKEIEIENIGEALSADERPVIKYSHLGGSDAWDPSKYLNIWLGRRIETLGESTFPNHPIAMEDGLIIDMRYFGRRGNNFIPFHLGRVVTHELGHYFGLAHPWGSDSGCSSDDDMIEDTPFQEGPYFDCPEFPQISCNSADMYMNFMNFCDDDCLYFFTKDQSNLMIDKLHTLRSGLISGSGCTLEDSASMELSGKIQVRFLHTHMELEFDQNDDATYQISFFTILGERISQDRIRSRIFYTKYTTDWPVGVYIIQITSGDERFSRKFFKGIF